MNLSQIEIHDVLTGEIIRRDLNEVELATAQAEKLKADQEAEAKVKEEEARDRKRREVLDRLGITAEELKTILS